MRINEYLDPEIHRVSNLFGNTIFPHYEVGSDWILPTITHAPTVSFYHMLELWSNKVGITDQFKKLQRIFETEWNIYTPIIDSNFQSRVIDDKILSQYKRKLKSNEKLLYPMRYILSLSHTE